MSNDITIGDGRMYGGWRQPVNIWQGAPGSIHTDEVAQKVGMRGGTIPGTIHLNLFPPLLVALWGERWFERGSLSIYYTYATLHMEEVRAVITLPPEGAADVQVEAWVEMKDGKVVAKGTVAVGEPREVSYLRGLELESAKPEDLRLLAGLKVGDKLPTRDALITQAALDQALERITDPLDWYRGSSPWGPSIVNPALIASTMMTRSGDLQVTNAVGFYGATELRFINGPVKVGVPYRVGGQVICVGVSARTEYFWFDAFLEEKETGKRVVEMREMNRVMKAGSAAYEGQSK